MSGTHAYYGIDAQHAHPDIGDVHGTALRSVGSGDLSVQFSHHSPGINSLC
jgi:hypothetical protein